MTTDHYRAEEVVIELTFVENHDVGLLCRFTGLL